MKALRVELLALIVVGMFFHGSACAQPKRSILLDFEEDGDGAVISSGENGYRGSDDGMCVGRVCAPDANQRPVELPPLQPSRETTSKLILSSNGPGALERRALFTARDADTLRSFVTAAGGSKEIVAGAARAALGTANAGGQIQLAIYTALDNLYPEINVVPQSSIDVEARNIRAIRSALKGGMRVERLEPTVWPLAPDEGRIAGAVRDWLDGPADLRTDGGRRFLEVLTGFALKRIEQRYSERVRGFLDSAEVSNKSLLSEVSEALPDMAAEANVGRTQLTSDTSELFSRDWNVNTAAYDQPAHMLLSLPRSLQSNLFYVSDGVLKQLYLRSADYALKTSPASWPQKYRARAAAAYQHPGSRQALIAQFIVDHLVGEALVLNRPTTGAAAAEAERRWAEALLLVGLVSGLVPVIGEGRDFYEAYSGEDILTGEQLSELDRSTRVLSIAMMGSGSVIPLVSIERLTKSIAAFGRRRASTPRNARRIADILAEEAARVKENMEILDKVTDSITGSRRKRFYNAGSITKERLDILGRAFVGPGATKIFEDLPGSAQPVTIFLSRDELRRYRPPSWKGDKWGVQGNLEARASTDIKWPNGSNAHFDIEN